MFTGLVHGVGTLAAREPRGTDARLRIGFGHLDRADVELGESIAVNGTCLTVAAFDDGGFEADASAETLAVTTLGCLPVGRAVNLERALRAGERLGGHLVSGHVDGVGSVLSVAAEAGAQRWRFRVPRPLMRYIATKGSVAVDGTSLTVNAVDGDVFEVALVPHTLAHTAFAGTHPGDPVNLEVDQVARYVERLLQERA